MENNELKAENVNYSFKKLLLSGSERRAWVLKTKQKMKKLFWEWKTPEYAGWGERMGGEEKSETTKGIY